MAKVVIEEPHALPPVEAKTRLDKTLAQLAARYGGEVRWASEVEAQLKHKLATASLRIEAARVSVDIEGGMAFALIKGKVEARVKQELQSALKT
jgi:putative polyhydroxyalkanoate system protein